MYALLCAFCLNLPGRSQGSDAAAVAVINGHSVCIRHYEFALPAQSFLDALGHAEEWELAMLPPGRTPLW